MSLSADYDCNLKKIVDASAFLKNLVNKCEKNQDCLLLEYPYEERLPSGKQSALSRVKLRKIPVRT